MSELVSIVTPIFNASRYIAQTIESVLAQRYQNWELLLSDDCSTDDSMSIAKSFQENDDRIKILESRENTGPAGCRNRAIRAASGKYIAFLDSDDFWVPEKLQLQIQFMQKAGFDLCYSSYRKIDEQGEAIGDPIFGPRSVDYDRLLNSNVIPCLTTIYNVERIGKYFMEDVGHEDYVYWLRILKDGYTAHGMPNVLAYYRVRSGSISNNKFKAASFQWKIYRNALNLNVWRSLYHFSIYSFLGLRKHKGF